MCVCVCVCVCVGGGGGAALRAVGGGCACDSGIPICWLTSTVHTKQACKNTHLPLPVLCTWLTLIHTQAQDRCIHKSRPAQTG